MAQGKQFNSSYFKRLLKYCDTEQNKKYVEFLIENNSFNECSKHFGVADSTVGRSIKRLDHIATKMGDSHVIKYEAPAGFSIDRVSTFVDDEGKVSRQWVIANRDKEDKYNAMLEAWTDVCESMPKAALSAEPIINSNANLLCDYTIGDNHTGLYAWAKEAGDDWNLDSSVGILKNAMNHLVYHAPDAHTAFILDVGDFFHSDNMDNETRRSGNKLDVDTRWAKVLSAGIECLCYLIDIALQKHKKVIYRSVIGNHNEHSAIMINIAIKLRYSNEPRVEVLDNPSMFNYYQFGINLLADTHGHTVKADNLPLLMATDVPQMWSETTNRIWRTGHVHHLSQKEYSGCTVITYRTLAPKDAWHSSMGYRSNREMRCTVYHKDRGTVGINIVNPTMLGYV